ncbi:hypothetical protein HYH03_003539 [Edaphochlamys debaryana]|uniref:SET domain-containing protein n=1 Tax=Edaphochlamys debaryana TaxID=47281 RepID=A0A835YBM4_9CHLO|nr:hypothetical protein HYH03_003539 [Edaphochlamys debaryana]|eukprot:KAG2498278.1 hypothetical protein HYH03_003539 [Edaphochlamys debaryana]
MTSVKLLSVCMCLAACLHTLLAQDTSLIDELFSWISKNGGVINAEVRINKDGVRGLFATERIPKLGLIASIPAACMINVGSQSQSASTHIMHVLREYKLGNNSRFWPYIKTWPKYHEMATECNMDDKYVPMWKSDHFPERPAPSISLMSSDSSSPAIPLPATHDHGSGAAAMLPPWTSCREANHQTWQGFLRRIWDGSANRELEYTIEEVVGKDVEVTLADVKYAAAITVSRYLAVHGRPRLMMAPIFDLANHDNHCTTYLESYVKSDYLHMKAGVDYEPGDEICYSYGDLRDDYAVSAYGFLPALEDPPRLAYVDHPGFEPRGAYRAPSDDRIAGPPEALRAEVQRLAAIRARITGTPDIVPRAEGEDWVWDMMKQLEARRIAAIDYELARIAELLAEATGDAREL